MSNLISANSSLQNLKGREISRRSRRAPYENMVWVPGGTFLMGSNDYYPEESPAHYVTVDGFWMDKHPITNADFSLFIEKTGYLTVSERAPNPTDYPGAKAEFLQPGSIVFRKPATRVSLNNYFNWWVWMPGASWRHPHGQDSSLKGLAKHPVVHIAYEDAVAYSIWAGKELPTEAEWEFAARGGLDSKVYAWGDDFTPQGKIMANTWHGEFPVERMPIDGFVTTSNVGSFPANGYGLFDMTGNVWEWTTDWFQAYSQMDNLCCSSHNPKGGVMEQSFDPQFPQLPIPRKVLKGGSYLCAPNYCYRYRPAARIPQQIDTGTCHQGFRCIVRVKEHL